jgi:Fe2+ transport system protein FeoA
VTEHALIDCLDGYCGVISRVEGNGQVTARLRELGFIPGEWVRVIRHGNPAILQVGDSRFCLRTEQISGITVQPHAD